MLYARGSFSGNYIPSDPAELAQGNYIIGHEFAAPPEGWEDREQGWGPVNQEIAEIIVTRFADKPIYAASTVARALRHIAPELELAGVFKDTSSDTTGSKGGTWSELEQARLLAGEGRPVHVGHAYHAARIAMQSQKMGLEPLLPDGLPSSFDTESAQWWCRSPWQWALREVPGVLYLRYLGQI